MTEPDRLAWLAQVAPSLEGSGVIYVLTIADTRVASFRRTQLSRMQRIGSVNETRAG